MFNDLFVATLAEARRHSEMVNDAFRLAMAENLNPEPLYDLIKQGEWVEENSIY